MSDIFGKMADDIIKADLAALTKRVESLEANVRDHEQAIGKRDVVTATSPVDADALWDAAKAVVESYGAVSRVKVRDLDRELYSTLHRLHVVVDAMDRYYVPAWRPCEWHCPPGCRG